MRFQYRLIAVGDGSENIFSVSWSETNVPSLFAFEFSCFFGVKVILTTVSPKYFFLLGDRDLFGNGFSCLEFHSVRLIIVYFGAMIILNPPGKLFTSSSILNGMSIVSTN